MMIWRIFKKDWTLLWPAAAAAALAHAIAVVLWLREDVGDPNDVLQGVSQFFPLIALLGSALVSIAVVQNDPIPGDREDWLARPIRRTDLLAAKLLFVVLAVAGPIVLVSIGDGLLGGFSLGTATSAAFWRGLAALVRICLPAMLLGAITRNMVEAVLGALIAGAAGTALLVFFEFAGIHPTTNNSGLLWWGSLAFSNAVIFAAALVILPLQYLRRSTAVSRLLIFPFGLLLLLFQMLPWNALFSAQQALAPSTPATARVAISLDPGQPRSPRTAITAGVMGHAALVNLPIRADGVPAGEVLFVDRAAIRLVADGAVIYREDDAEDSYDIPAFFKSRTRLRQKGANGAALHGYLALLLPVSVMNRVRNRNVTLEVDYSLSLFRPDATGTLAALDGSARLDRIGWCRTGIDDDGDGVELRCVQPGQDPTCLSAVLENPTTGQRDPEFFACAPNYSPIPLHFMPDAFGRFFAELKFTARGEAGKYPVGESQLARARADLVSYQPVAHLTRHLAIPNVRLGDWEAPIANGGASAPSE